MCSQPSWQLLRWWQWDCDHPVMLLVPCGYHNQDHGLNISVCLQRSHLHPRHCWQHLLCLHSWHLQCGRFFVHPQACQLHSLPSWKDHPHQPRRHISGPVHNQHLQRRQGMEWWPVCKLPHVYLQCGRQCIQPKWALPSLSYRQDNTQHWCHQPGCLHCHHLCRWTRGLIVRGLPTRMVLSWWKQLCSSTCLHQVPSWPDHPVPKQQLLYH